MAIRRRSLERKLPKLKAWADALCDSAQAICKAAADVSPATLEVLVTERAILLKEIKYAMAEAELSGEEADVIRDLFKEVVEAEERMRDELLRLKAGVETELLQLSMAKTNADRLADAYSMPR